MIDNIRRHPRIAAGGTLLATLWAIRSHLSSATATSLALVTGLSMLLGGLLHRLYFWSSLQETTEVDPSDSGIPTNPVEIFLHHRSLAGWLEGNNRRLTDLSIGIERVSHLLGVFDFTTDLDLQLRVALSLSRELFPMTGIMIFLRRDGQLAYRMGVRHGEEDSMVPIDEKGPLALRAKEIISSTIDLKQIQDDDWKGFSIPYKNTGSYPELTVMPLMIWNRILGFTVYHHADRHDMKDDEQVLASLFNRHLAVCIENHLLFNEKAQERQGLHDSELARQIQTECFPHLPASLRGFEFFGSCVPCREISGDYFDLVPISGDRLLAVIAGSSGRGLPAALFQAKLQTLIHAYAETCDSPARLLNFLSKFLSREGRGPLFATMLVVMVKADSGQLLVANAGHCKPLVFRQGSGFVEAPNVEAGIPLGLIESGDDGYVDQAIDLMPGDGMLLFTDGITEAIGHSTKRYGTEGINRVLEKLPAATRAEGLVTALFDDVKRFRSPDSPEDDATVVYLRLEKPTA